MKDNKPVNDIFQNDNGSKNKTKTMLLLTIVAIILISVFLIIAWVMTRDNPLQNIQKENKDETVLNGGNSQTLPYEHDNGHIMDSNNPLGLDTNMDSIKSQDYRPSQNPISNIPPSSVPTDTAVILGDNTKLSKDDDIESDARFQSALRDIEKQHNDKKKAEAKTKESTKENPLKESSGKENEHGTTKMITPSTTKNTTVAIAPDPTKSTQKSKDSEKVLNQKLQKQDDSSKKIETKKPEATKPKEVIAKPKDSEKTSDKKSNDNIIPKPQNNVISTNQGKTPEQGYYLQVGVFTQNPAQSFLNKITKYNYRVLKIEEDGITKSKYLIGPYISKNKAKEAEQKVREEVESKASVIFYQKQTKQ